MGPKQAWQPPIGLASAVKDEGVAAVWEAIRRHDVFLRESGTLETRRLQRVKQEVIALVAERAKEEARRTLEGDTEVGRRLRDNRNGKLNPYALAAEVMAQQNRNQGGGDGASQ